MGAKQNGDIEKFCGDLLYGRTAFHATNYHTTFTDEPKEQSVESVARALAPLSGDITNFKAEFEGKTQLPVNERCAWLWTTGAYRAINWTVIQDDAEALKRWMPMIRGMNQFIKHNQPQSPVTTWRGSRANVASYIPGVVYRFGQFVATSLKPEKAMQFRKSCLLEFAIPKDCWNASYLEDLTEFPGEHEVLLPPYTVATCTEVDVAKDIHGTITPYARFEVAKDNKKAERFYEPFANKFISTNYFHLLKQGELLPEPDVPAVEQAVAPYAPLRSVNQAQRMVAQMAGAPRFSSVSDAELFAAALFADYNFKGDDFLPAANRVLLLDAPALRELMPWTRALLGFIAKSGQRGLPRQVFKTFRSNPQRFWDIEEKQIGEQFILSADFWNAFGDLQAAKAMAGTGEWPVLVIADIPENCPWAACINELSGYANEAEVVVAPYALATKLSATPGEHGFQLVIRIRLMDVKEPAAHILHGLTVVEG